ncbi:MAG: tRNA (adenosine(37)-N6)-threonylcarbamoyltransferase complex ATPase subunit type 1 TsaE [Steroidobacteraceae bacterium]
MLLSDSDATEALGARFARHLPEARAPLIVYLDGQLGAGKTTFARGLLRALGVTGAVRSPSYTLVEQYPIADRLVLHLDLYRLGSEAEFEQLGTRDHFIDGALWLVEWPEHAPRALPPPDLQLHFEPGATGHNVQMFTGSPDGRVWLAAALSEVGALSR